MKVITQNWLNYAETDLRTCKQIINDEFLTNVVAFHAQQVVEKCFKAIIEENTLKVPRIHSLIRLFDKIEGIIDFAVAEQELKVIDKVYTEARYPADIGMLPDGKPSLRQANRMYEFAQQIFEETTQMLSARR